MWSIPVSAARAFRAFARGFRFSARAARHRRTGFVQNRPPAAEKFGPVAVGFARALVLDEGVDRVAGVRDLQSAVLALGRPELGGHRTFAGGRRALRGDRRPVFFAFAVTRGGRALVFGELV